MAKNELICVSYISTDDNEPRLWNSLTPQEHRHCVSIMAERIGRTLSDYFTQHPQEYGSIL